MHRASWPEAAPLTTAAAGADPSVLADTSVALSQVRKAKSEAKVSMRTDVSTAVLSGPAEAVARVLLAAEDLCGAGRIQDLTTEIGGDALAVEVKLA